MFKVIVADDEHIERKALKHIIKTYRLPLEIVAEVSNGVDAVEQARKINPDIIIMDIKMPGIDGLEAISEILKINPNIICIILSAYDEFDYARKAVKLGVFDYILKPARNEDIVKILNNVIIKLNKERKYSNEFRQLKEDIEKIKPYLLLSLVNNIISEDNVGKEISTLAKILEMEQLPHVVMVIGFNFKNDSIENLDNLKQEILNIIKECFSDIPTVLVVPDSSNKIVLFISIDRFNEHKNGKEVLYQLAENIQKRIREKIFLDTTIGIGNYYQDIKALRDSYLQAQKAYRLGKNILGCNEIIHIDDLTQKQINFYGIYKQGFIKANELYNYVKDGSWELIIENLKSLLNEIIAFEVSYKIKLAIIIEIISVLSRAILEKGIEREKIIQLSIDYYTRLVISDNLEDAVNYTVQLVKDFQNLVDENYKTTNAKIIISAKEYIEKNYYLDISLKNVAKKVNLSPYYFSKQFKKETNKTFQEYLTKTRINQAKKLLENPNVSVQDVANKVGYSDSSYFCRLFKKNEGITPSEYRIHYVKQSNRGASLDEKL